jgi:putative hydrolase of the HAD superfamily
MKPFQIIFDLGGVLVEWEPQAIAEKFTPDPGLRESLLVNIFHHRDWVEKDRGSLTTAQLETRFAARTGLSAREIRALMAQVRASLHLKTETLAWVRELKAGGFPLYCLSNMPADHEAYLRERYGFWDLFDGIVTSNRVGMVKPEPVIFQHLLETHGLEPENCVFIDDGKANIRVARSFGIRGIQFKSIEDARPQFERMLGSNHR